MNKDLGARLIELRLALGLTQEKFAEKIRVSTGYMSSLEQSHRKLNVRLIKLIADSFGASEKWLETGSGSMFTTSQDTTLSEIIDIYNQLHPDLQKLVIKQLKILLEINDKLPPEKPKSK
ncbi:helix-turn-helix domain-containing protein [Treponema primitia]|uniref:helix-turn-helix transcriptional regulator n=1 Tax=Treponema primitia TaxID=88058 RepID=UPI0039812171